MAAQFSFDVVSQVDFHEVRNAFEQANREIITRFDFKGTDTAISLDEDLLELRSSTENRLKAAVEVLKEKMIRRNVPLKALSEGPVLPAARGNVRQNMHINQGISDERAREINKIVKGSGLKVQSQVQKDQVRVTGKSKNDLQQIMNILRESDLGIPLQFTNYRP